jgi:hypothetical protein
VEERCLLDIITSVRVRDQLLAGVEGPASHVAPPGTPGDTDHSPPTVAGPPTADGSAATAEGEQIPGGGEAGAVVVPLIDLEEGAVELHPVDIDLSPGLISIEVYDSSPGEGVLDTPPLFEDIMYYLIVMTTRLK